MVHMLFFITYIGQMNSRADISIGVLLPCRVWNTCIKYRYIVWHYVQVECPYWWSPEVTCWWAVAGNTPLSVLNNIIMEGRWRQCGDLRLWRRTQLLLEIFFVLLFKSHYGTGKETVAVWIVTQFVIINSTTDELITASEIGLILVLTAGI